MTPADPHTSSSTHDEHDHASGKRQKEEPDSVPSKSISPQARKLFKQFWQTHRAVQSDEMLRTPGSRPRRSGGRQATGSGAAQTGSQAPAPKRRSAAAVTREAAPPTPAPAAAIPTAVAGRN